MRHVLVVGSTGQLGSEVVRQAATAGHRVRALVRHGSHHEHLRMPGVEIVFGDLRDGPSLERVCEGITDVVATATVIFPRGVASFQEDEGQGYGNLVSACKTCRIERFLFVSIIPIDRRYLEAVPFLQMKVVGYELLRTSGLPHTIVRCSPFMDEYFAIMGSAIPLEGEVAASLNRCRGVMRLIRRLCGRTIERFGVACVPGPETSRHAFIAVSDVAAYLVAAMARLEAGNTTLTIGGPETLSWRQVAALYSQLLGRPVRVLSLPARLFKFLADLTRPLSEALSNQISVLWVVGETESVFDSRGTAAQYGIALTTAESYLRKKVVQYRKVAAER